MSGRHVTLTLAATAGLIGSLMVAPATSSSQSRPSVAGGVATVSAPPKIEPPPPIRWRRCLDRYLHESGARCGFVRVPLDYDDPRAGTIAIAVARIRHTGSRYQGPMLVNPGGPGSSGRWLATYGSLMPGGSGASYDWIGFDPRGTGASRPRMVCQLKAVSPPLPSYVPHEDSLALWIKRSKRYAEACGRRHPHLLPNMSTEDLARDMDMIRLALGVKQISYYGYSYGTYLGQVYASLFPDRLQRMVLDSNIHPDWVWYDYIRPTVAASERLFGRWTTWVARRHDRYGLGRTPARVQRTYYAQLRDLSARPIGRLGPAEWTDVFLAASYWTAYWPDLAELFAQWIRTSNPRPLLRWLGGWPDDTPLATYLAVTCLDAPHPGVEQMVADAEQLHREYPWQAWSWSVYAFPCAFWPSPAEPTKIAADPRTSILLVSGTLDAPTPYEGSLAVRELFAGSRLVAIRGGISHGSTPDASGPCVGRILKAYLERGKLPPRVEGRQADVVCGGPPLPARELTPLTPLRPSFSAARGLLSP